MKRSSNADLKTLSQSLSPYLTIITLPDSVQLLAVMKPEGSALFQRLGFTCNYGCKYFPERTRLLLGDGLPSKGLPPGHLHELSGP